ncbi:MAG: septum formation protein Maf [Lachnospiraceae bacterium]|nr:septum formation protein Maf [Lachnospiraceae bacterium]
MDKKIILASASPRRRELLAQIGMDFEVRASYAEEKTEAKDSEELVKELSALKALDIWEKLSEEEKKTGLVIGADTVVSICGAVMGKPKDREDAAGMLSLLQGRTHQVYTGVTFIYLDEKGDRDTGRKTERRVNSFFEKTDVLVFPMSEEEIARYVDTGDPMDKAGAYGIQGIFAAYIKGIAGDYNNVVGLPVGRLYQELKKI